MSAADGWARVSGTIGVCDATVGPGVTNLVSGLAEAMACSIPVLAVVADIRRDREHLRRRSIVSQGMEQGGLLASVSKWVARLQEPGSVDELVSHALRVATTGRPGPVVLEIPEDVFSARVPRPPSRTFTAEDFAFPRHRSAPTPAALDAAVAVLSAAERPVVLAGGGVVLSRSSPDVAAFARELQIPVVTSINGKGTIDERDRLAGGVTGVFGTVRATQVLQAADAVLVLGSKLDQSTTHRFRVPSRTQQVVHVDLDGEEIGRTGPVAVAVLADVGETCRALLPRLRGRMRHDLEWFDAIPSVPTPGSRPEGDDAVAPTAIASAIAEAQDERDLLLCDASLSSGWGAANAVLPGEGVRFLAPRGLAGLGWSCGAAIGARLALPDDGRLVVLVGDGGWAYGMGEVETVVRAGLPITTVILNNSALAWVTQGEADAGIEPTSTFTTVDFAAAARALGAEGTVAPTIEEFRDQLGRARISGRPWVIDVRSSALASPVLALSRINRPVR